MHPRILWAVEALAPAPTDHVLEVGCGPGVAAGLVADLVPDGHVTAIDRSPHAVDRASGSAARQIAAGRLSVRHAALADLAGDPAHRGRYDVVFAVNVNLFWAARSRAEAATVRHVLRPTGTCLLFYDVPDAALAARTTRLTRETLGALGFVTEPVRGPAATFVGVHARLDPAGASLDG